MNKNIYIQGVYNLELESTLEMKSLFRIWRKEWIRYKFVNIEYAYDI